jgi:TRAP-type mannitol/chloroaromatic compound transport system permease small subunit
MEKLLIVIMIALIAESVWETLKMTWQEGKVSTDRIGALVVALVLCIGVKLDILSLLGINTTIPFLGVILTGILISRGSNFIHDLLVKIGQVGKGQE